VELGFELYQLRLEIDALLLERVAAIFGRPQLFLRAGREASC